MCSVSDEVYLVMDRVIYAIVRRYGREKSGVRAGVTCRYFEQLPIRWAHPKI